MNNIYFLDGAIGSELIMKGEKLPPHIWSAKINLTNPNLLLNIYKEYVKAGSNYITTNTFRTTPRAYKKIGLSDLDAIQTAKKSMQSAIKIAEKAAGDNVKKIASIAPLEDCYISEDFPGENIARKEFSVLVGWFEDSNIDGYILETMNNILETKICLELLNSSSHPIWVSFNLLDSSHIQSGEKLEDAIDMVSNFNVDYFLLNCNPLNRTYDALKILSTKCSKWGIYPNLGKGEPSPDGIITDHASDEEFLLLCKQAIDLGATVIGGCCGTSPRHIKLLTDSFIQ